MFTMVKQNTRSNGNIEDTVCRKLEIEYSLASVRSEFRGFITYLSCARAIYALQHIVRLFHDDESDREHERA